MSRKRQPIMPKSPVTAHELAIAFEDENIMKTFGMTKSNPPSNFFKKIYQCDAFSYCIFASDKVIALIQANLPVADRHFLIDATFKVCPFGSFKQLLIIYIKYMQKVNYI